MRPDEHKQKKNTQYKKKHGIKTGKSGTEESKTADKGKRQQGGNEDRNKGYRKRGDNETGASSGRSQASKTSDSSDSETESNQSKSVVFERKSFSRRQIVSNWEKYDLPETVDDDSSQPRGEDFSKLLASAGDAFAQFRFKDEQDWDDSSSGLEGNKIISLDCQGLADAVDCLPLYRRLGLDKETFTESQIILQELEAERRQGLYDSATGKCLQSEMNETSNIVPVEQGKSIPETKSRKQQGEITLSSLAKPSNVNLDFIKPVTDEKLNKRSLSEKSSAKPTPEANLDEDLDFLLSLDTPSKSNIETTANHTDMDKESSDKQDEKTPQDSVDVTQSLKTEKATTDKEEDLEDWLDSVLED